MTFLMLYDVIKKYLKTTFSNISINEIINYSKNNKL